ncbi:hypothetical protein LBMAG42_54740 [Deltaproteobacteria bacterium]|nr:hypothetical protein LBMAG42_54740 [Deltaproteobacteria bacterium]
MKKQEKNWRLEGYCPTTPWYRFVEPGVLFAMEVDSSNTPATASWVVLPLDHPARVAILRHGESARLQKSGMVALHGAEGIFCRRVLSEHFPNLFTPSEGAPSMSNTTTGLEPDPLGLFEILARAGHKLPSAVADLVDNSISHGATTIDITFPNPNQGGRWMCVRDDGNGMTPSELRDAMKIGHRRSYADNDLGKFGYGLKGASWSQADSLTVVTRTAGAPVSQMTWDKEHLALTRAWVPLTAPVDAKYASVVDIPVSGTAVLLTKMRPPVDIPPSRGVDPYTLEVTAIREHLELVFHRFLQGRVPGKPKISIRVEGRELVPNDPMGHPLTKQFDARTIELNPLLPDRAARIGVQAFITPNEEEFDKNHRDDPPDVARDARNRLTLGGRWNESQGFYFYRLHRLIKWGGWEDIFTRDEKTKLLRVSVDFDRNADDPLQVDISKQLVRLPLEVAEHIEKIVKEPRAEARSRYAKKVDVPPPPPVPGGKDGPQVPPPPPGNGPGKGGGKPKPPKGERSPIRLVEGGSRAWERKLGFMGEQVEVTPRVAQLVALVKAIEGDTEAKTALSEFLRVLEARGVVEILDAG